MQSLIDLRTLAMARTNEDGTPRFPELRKVTRCPGAKYYSSNSWPCINGLLQWRPFNGDSGGDILCPHKWHDGPGYVWNTEPYDRGSSPVREAVEAVGWGLSVNYARPWNGDYGDQVAIIGWVDTTPVVITPNGLADKYRDEAALLVALLRAEGVEI